MQQVKTNCKYCHGVTFDDDLGHCAACGAPRSQDDIPYQYSPPAWGLPTGWTSSTRSASAAFYGYSIMCTTA